MACPTCGGADRHAIAPGFFECASPITVVSTQMVPDPGMPGWQRPLDLPESRPCGRRYHEVGNGPGPAGGPTCECGTFAIGRCAACDRPVCGDHSDLSDGRRLCNACAEAERAATANAAAACSEEAARILDQGAQLLLRQFLERAQRGGWPGVEDVHEVRRLSAQERLQEARKASARRTFGWGYMGEPTSWSERRAERRSRPRSLAGRVVARGWDTGRIHNAGPRTAVWADDNPANELQPILLLTDGRQQACTRDPADRRVWLAGPLITGGPELLTGGVLFDVLVTLAGSVGVGLDVPAEVRAARTG